MSREGKLVKNTAILSLGTFLPKLAAYITLPILTGLLTKDEYGTFDLVTVLVSLLLPAATLQIQTAAFRFLIDERENEASVRSIITNIYVFIVPLSLVTLLALYFFLPDSSPLTNLFICLYFLVDVLVNAARQIARGLGRTMDYSLSAIISAAGKVVFVVLFVQVLRMGLLGTVIAFFGASTISFLVLAIRIRLYRYIDLSVISGAELRRMLAYSWPMVPNSMSMWVMRLSDRLVVTAFMGPAANAVYAVANKLPGMLNVAQSAFTLAWQENASIVSKDEDAEAYYSSMFHTMFNLMAGFLGLIICATPLLFMLLIRGDYAEAYFQMPVLFLAAFFYSMATFLGGIYVAYMKTKSVGITTAAAAACNLIVDLALIRFIGLYAASGSTLVSYLFLMIYRMIDVRKIVSLKYDFKNIAAVSLVLITECVLCYLQMPVTDLINLLLGVAAFIILNRSFLRALKVKTLQLLRRGK